MFIVAGVLVLAGLVWLARHGRDSTQTFCRVEACRRTAAVKKGRVSGDDGC
jgi:hypothetical protein